jgi:transposase
LLGTAKLNGLNPAEWLKDSLEKLPAWLNSRIDELLPLTPAWIETINQNRPKNNVERLGRCGRAAFQPI